MSPFPVILREGTGVPGVNVATPGENHVAVTIVALSTHNPCPEVLMLVQENAPFAELPVGVQNLSLVVYALGLAGGLVKRFVVEKPGPVAAGLLLLTKGVKLAGISKADFLALPSEGMDVDEGEAVALVHCLFAGVKDAA